MPDPIDDAKHIGLIRAIGPISAAAVIVGSVIGSGIFYKPGTIARDGGEFGLIISAWAAGGILSLLGALCLAELGVMMPQAGGPYVYLREAYGRPVAFLFGWNDFFFIRPASSGALAVVVVDSISRAARWEGGPISRAILAASLVLIVGAVNFVGVVWGSRLQLLTTVIKAGVVAIIGLAPLFVLSSDGESLSLARYATTVPTAQHDWTVRFGVVLLAVLWAYDGWTGLAPLAEEIRDPSRNIPIAFLVGVGLLTVLYTAANVSLHGFLSMSEMADAGKYATFELAKRLLGPVGETLTSAAVAFSAFGALNSNLLIYPRIAFAMGRDGVFFRSLGAVHVVHRTPGVAIVVQTLMAVGLVVASTCLIGLVDYFRQTSLFDLLTDFAVFGGSIFYALAVSAVIVLRRTAPDCPREYRTPGYPLSPIVFLISYSWFLLQVYQGKPVEAKIGLALIAIGLPVYYLWRRWDRRDSQP